jgi:hypothetical protein
MSTQREESDSSNATKLVSNIGLLAAIIVPIVSVGINWGVVTTSQNEMKKRLDDLDGLKLAEVRLQNEYMTRRVDKLENDRERMTSTINDMDKKLTVIAEWVLEQKALRNK